MTTIGSVTSLPPTLTTQVQEPPEAVEAEGVAEVEIEVEGSPESGAKQSGVIRNILAGRFKGVAAIRLQINFADQLGALQAAATAEAAGDATTSFIDDAKEALDGLLANLELSAEQQADLTELAETFLADLAAIDGTVTSSTDEFEQQLDDLRAALEASLAAAGTEPIIVSPDADVEADAEVVPDEQTVDSSSLLADAEALMAYLEAELAAAIESVDDSPPLLQPLSGPSGAGAAYSKFLSLYEGEPMPSESGTGEAIARLGVSA